MDPGQPGLGSGRPPTPLKAGLPHGVHTFHQLLGFKSKPSCGPWADPQTVMPIPSLTLSFQPASSSDPFSIWGWGAVERWGGGWGMSKNVTRVPPPQEEQRELLRVRTSQQIQWHHSHECKRCQMFAQSRVMGNGLSLSSI